MRSGRRAPAPAVPEPAPEPPPGPGAPGWGQVWGVLSGVVAPATLVTALLFYFGYVATRSQFRYFGVDVDTLGYTTQEFVMRAPQSLLVPGLTLLLVTAALVWGDGLVRRWLAHAPAATVRRVRGVAGAVGVLLLTAGVALVALYRPLLDWLPYPLVTSLLLGSGALTVERALAWRPGATGFRVERVLLLLVVLVATLWATATVAERSGRGSARLLAADLTDLPEVVLDTPGRLFPGDETVREQALPASGSGFAYRYRGLRLLAAGDATLLLVPETWTESGSTFVVPLADVRVKYRFVDDPP